MEATATWAAEEALTVAAAASPAAPVVECRGVAISYGRRRLLEPLDLQVPAGAVYALLGRNGEGKSSLVRVLLGLQRAAAGDARLLGRDPWRERVALMSQVGYVAEDPQAQPEMTARQLVAFCGRLRRRWDGAGALARLRRFGVPADVPFRRLSKGQRKQVELALALAHRPRLLVLDDPSLGLDPVARRALFGEVIEELAGGATTVFLTTHDLAAVEGVADHVGVLAGGRLVVDEPLEGLKARFRRLRFAGAARPAPRDLEELEPVTREERPWGHEVVVGRWRESAAGLEARAMTLEEIFTVLHRQARPAMAEPEAAS
jgi:ABC-2 type transport system ATP-binding protein